MIKRIYAMKNIKLLNKIAKIGTDKFDTREFCVGEEVGAPDAIMVRSAAMHDMTFNKELLAIARAGAGVNNIPVERCAKEGIVVFNTPGANANGVKELALCALLLASRDVVGGVKFAEGLADGCPDIAKAVEKGKSAFAGCEVMGKTLGVIGLGAIGGLVANSARSLGMNVLGYDPYITVRAAWNLSHSVHNADGYDDVFMHSDYITLHVPATETTRGMINKESIAKMRDGVKIINLARADLVNMDDLKEALASGKVSAYVTDFPTEQSVGVKGIVNIPHLGASTEESEDNCAVMAANELIDYIKYGNISNSVNYPAVSLAPSGLPRVCVMHLNVANMISPITSAISKRGINIENMTNGSRGDFAYTMLEPVEKVDDDIIKEIESLEGVIRVRAIQ